MHLPKDFIRDLNESTKIVRPQNYAVTERRHIDNQNAEDDGRNISGYQNESHKWVALVVPRRRWCDKDGRFYGPLMTKISRLEKLGYHVIAVPNATKEKYRRKEGENHLYDLLKIIV